MRDALVSDFGQGKRRALSQLLTLAAQGQIDESILERLPVAAAPARVIGFTGAAGVGKSTVIGRLIGVLRAAGHKVAVLACDPQSPLSGGALLGDRLRMPSQPDAGLFIRSLATPSGQGAVAQHLGMQIALLESFGFSMIIIETVGAGQGETGARDYSDLLVLLLQPEAGDEIQGEKAGVLEVADLVVFNKCDLPGIDRAEAEIRQGLEVSPGRHVPILRVSGKTGAGIAELVQALEKQLANRPPRDRGPWSLLRLAQERLSRRFRTELAQPNADFQALLKRWRERQESTDAAITELCALLLKK